MEYRPYHIDMHVHTKRYSSCAEFLDPLRIGRYGREACLDAVVLTEHNACWEREELHDLQVQLKDIKLFSGIEVATKEDCHLVIIGIEERGCLEKGIPAHEAISYARHRDGLIILAHPYRKPLPPLDVIIAVDAIEIGSTSLSERESRMSARLAETLLKPAVASSDAHALPMIGWAYTRLPEQPSDVRHLCSMIKEGRGEPVFANSFIC